MKRFAMLGLALALVGNVLAAQDLERLFKAAVNTETVDRHCKNAIEQYKKVAAGSNRALAAQALLRMADCYRQLDDVEAQKIYQRLVRDFPDQKDVIAFAQSRLEPKLNAVAGATLKDVDGITPSGYVINVSADGRYATHVNGSTGNIAVRELRSGVSRDITQRQDFVVQDPVISRDGKYVAYQSFNGCVEGRPSAPGTGDLCVLPIDGEPSAKAKTLVGRADVREVRPMDWSPDRRSLAVVLHRQDGTTQVGIVRLADGAVSVLQSTDWRGATRIFFSPDGRYVAFDVGVDEGSDDLSIQVVAVDGSHGATAVRHASQNVVMGWTPDGSHLLFASDRAGNIGLWAQRMSQTRAEGPARLIHAGLGGGRSLGLTKSGALYFEVQSGNRDIEVVTVDLAASKQILSPVHPVSRYVGTNAMPEWSRDGKFLAYVSGRGFSGSNDIVIGIRESSTGSIRELRPRLISSFGLAWAPDNSALLTAGTDLKGRSGIFSIDANTGEARFVVEGAFPSYAVDGRRIYYLKGDGPRRSIIERDRKSGAERTVATGQFLRATLSPDGRWFAAASGGAGAAAAEVITIAAETGELRRLYQAQSGDNIPTGVNLAWTPDGQAVLMRKRPPLNELWLIPTTGAPPRKIEADVNGWSFGIAGAISLHPDGRQIAATRVRQQPGAAVRVLENFLSAVK